MNETATPATPKQAPALKQQPRIKLNADAELHFWQLVYAAAVSANAGNAMSGFAKQCADNGLAQMRQKVANLNEAPSGDCVSRS